MRRLFNTDLIIVRDLLKRAPRAQRASLNGFIGAMSKLTFGLRVNEIHLILFADIPLQRIHF